MPGRLSQRAAQAAMRLSGFESRQVATAAGRVHCLEAQGLGDIPTLVVLHGLSSAGFHYYPLLKRLRPRVRRLVAMDLPGHGLSEVPAEGLTPASMRDGIFGAIDALIGPDEKAVLFGNSLGGLVALRYALARPGRLHALVLFSPGGAAMTESELEALRRGFQFANHAEALAFVDRVHVFSHCSPMRHLYAWGVRRTFEPRHIQELVAGLRPDQLLSEEELAPLVVPTLLLWGEHDRVLPMSGLDFFRRALPGHAHVELYPGAGHTPIIDEVGAISARVLDFLAQVPAAPAEASTESA